jgi:hypothetical protein
LILSFDDAPPATRERFEEFVEGHLQKYADPSSVRRSRARVCDCGRRVLDEVIRDMIAQGQGSFHCPYCGRVLRLSDLDRPTAIRTGPNLGASELQRKIDAHSFDVFICYNHEDKESARAIAEELKERNILPWMDEWSLRPGMDWQDVVQEVIGRVKSAAILYGPKGVSPAQADEIRALIVQYRERKCPVIPVILPKCTENPQLPPFISSHSWVDFRNLETHPWKQLCFGITGGKG